MESISANNCFIHFNDSAFYALNEHLKTNSYSVIFILVDTNTHDHCLPRLLSEMETEVRLEIIEIEAGEEHKTIDTCVGVWNALSELGGDRKSLMINLGGGVVTDLGGFVSCTFKRGIDYINVPTSLLAMVDASVGGKTGVDLGSLKNQVGVIDSGKMVLIHTDFLKTLPENQMTSGFAEMLKHGLIDNRNYWDALRGLKQLDPEQLDELIYDSVLIKKAIVTEDPLEKGIRKHLNFGHTLGHAIESYFLEQKESPLLHGEAIAIGMILESFISSEILDFPKKDLEQITSVLLSCYKPVQILESEHEVIIELLKHDKKNEFGAVNFVLLKAIGQPKTNCEVDHSSLIRAFEYYDLAISKN